MKNRQTVPLKTEKKVIGYTAGTFDLFHVGHLTLLENAKKMCDYLIVGVNSDELVNSYKMKRTFIKAEQRSRIVDALKVVNEVHIVHTLDKTIAWQMFHFDIVFIGSDWKGSERWSSTEEELAVLGANVSYLPYTVGISTSEISLKLKSDGEITKQQCD